MLTGSPVIQRLLIREGVQQSALRRPVIVKDLIPNHVESFQSDDDLAQILGTCITQNGVMFGVNSEPRVRGPAIGAFRFPHAGNFWLCRYLRKQIVQRWAENFETLWVGWRKHQHFKQGAIGLTLVPPCRESFGDCEQGVCMTIQYCLSLV